jgi:hypothetical protein
MSLVHINPLQARDNSYIREFDKARSRIDCVVLMQMAHHT